MCHGWRGGAFVPVSEWTINLSGVMGAAVREGKLQRSLVGFACLENEFNKLQVISAYL